MLANELAGSPTEVLVFEDFRLDVPRAEFSRAGRAVPLRPKAFALMLHLARNAGRVLTKNELLAQVWPGIVVTDDSLSQCVGELRDALGERGPALIRTLPRRGYRFDAQVRDEAGPQIVPAVARWPRRRAALWAVSATLVLGMLVGLGLLLARGKPARIDAAVVAGRSVAVMPLADLGPVAVPYLAEGITQELLTDLAHMSDALVVVGGAGPLDAKGIGHDLDVRHVVTGSVHHETGRVVVDMQMARTDTGALLWSERFEGERADGEWVRSISQRVAGSLEVKLWQSAGDLGRRDVANSEAMDLWMRGDYLLRHGTRREDLLEARRYLEAALAAEPQSMHALSALASSYLTEVVQRWSSDRKRTLATARALAQRALAIDPNHLLALSALANSYTLDSEFDAAAPIVEREVKENPNSARAYFDRIALLYYLARFEELKPDAAMALRLGSLDPTLVGKCHSILGFSLMVTGHDEEAYQELRLAVLAAPSMPGQRYGLIAAAALTGRMDEAHRLVAEALRDRPEMSIARLKAAGASTNLAFRKAHRRQFEGLRLAGLPEGDPPLAAASGAAANR